MSVPRRIQRRRVKGWRMPPGAVYVGRGSRWGNPWRAGQPGPRMVGTAAGDREWYLDPLLAVGAFERLTVPEQLTALPDWLEPLKGKDLVCWCRLDAPCHADVLLRLANEQYTEADLRRIPTQAVRTVAPADVLDRLEAAGHARSGFCERCWTDAYLLEGGDTTQADAYLTVLSAAELRA